MTIDHNLEGGSDLGRRRMLGKSSWVGESLSQTGSGLVSLGYDVRELWYRLLARPWSCLVVVAPDRTQNTLRLARSLAEVGTQLRRRPVEAIDGLDLDLDRAAAIVHRVEPQQGPPSPPEPRFVIALDPPTLNPIAFEVLAVGDGVLMLLEKGVTRIPRARKIVEAVGRERLMGAVLAE